MLKSFANRATAAVSAIALAGATFAAIPAGGAAAVSYDHCDFGAPQARATTQVTAPYGVSASRADLLTVKAINTTKYDCAEVVVEITPRQGTVFAGIVSLPAGWNCMTPALGEAGATTCYSEVLPKYSSQTIKVRYDRATPGGPVSGTASASLYFEGCGTLSTLITANVC